MMSPITVRADADTASSEVSETTEMLTVQKKEGGVMELPASVEAEGKTLKLVHRTRSGAAKLDAALQALNDSHLSNRGVNHKPPHSDEDFTTKRESRRNNSRMSSSGRSSEESTRSNGRKSGDGGSRRSFEGSGRRKSNENQRSTTVDSVPAHDDQSDQLSQITDILLARLITTLSDSTLGNPALLLQTLLGFSPDDYNDLLAALSESRLSYVDIISAYLHNIRVMSEDSGSTSAALSGTLTRSLIEQYNSLLSQAVKSPQNIARAAMVGDREGRSHLADLIHKANSVEGKSERRSFDGLLPKGPSGLGFGRRQSADSNKQKQQQASQTLLATESKPSTQGMPENTMVDFAKIIANNSLAGVSVTQPPPPQGANGLMTHDQFASILQSAGMLANGGTLPATTTPYGHQSLTVPSLPFLPQTGGNSMNGMQAMTMAHNPYLQQQMQPFTVPLQQHQLPAGTPANANRNGMSWQGATTVGFQQPAAMFRGWGGAGLETVHENFNAASHLQQADASLFPQAINMQQQHGQH